MRRLLVLSILLLFSVLVSASLTFNEGDYKDGLLYKRMAFDFTPVASREVGAVYSVEFKGVEGLPFNKSLTGLTVSLCEVKGGRLIGCEDYSVKTLLSANTNYRLIYEWRGVALTDSFKRVDIIPTFEGKTYSKYAWWNVTYNNETAMTVKTDSGITRVGYQVNYTLEDNGYMDSAISIRFANEARAVELPFWVDYENSVNGSYYSVWIKFDANLTTSDYDFYLYTGNSSPVGWASNAEGVFELYDTFDGASLNTTKWTYAENNADASYSVSGGELTLTPNASFANHNELYANSLSLSNGYTFEERSRITAFNAACYLSLGFTDSSGSVCAAGDFATFSQSGYSLFIQGLFAAAGNRIYEGSAGCVRGTLVDNMNVGSEASLELYRVYSFGYDYNYRLSVSINYVEIGSVTDSTFGTNAKTGFTGMSEYVSGAGGTAKKVEWARIRKFHNDTVSVSMGASVNITLNTTWVNVVDELPVNGTIFGNGSSIGLQGYCESNGTLTNATAWLNYYPNNTFADFIVNGSGLTNATSFNWTFNAPSQSLNYSWFIECGAIADGDLDIDYSNSSGRYFLTNLPAPPPLPSPTPVPDGGFPITDNSAKYVDIYDMFNSCRRVQLCVPFTDYCLDLWSVCEYEENEFIAK